MKLKITTQDKLVKALLICGILLPIIYVSIDTTSAILYKGYSYTDQAISELSAIGAPTGWMWKILNFLYSPLLVAFGIGVLKSAGSRRFLATSGILMIIEGTVGFGWLLFPMNMRGALGAATDTGHLVMSAITAVLMMLLIAFGSGVKKKWFRIYSILNILMMIGFGIYSTVYAVPRMIAQLPTPWMGIMERISVFSPIIWMGVLAAILLRDLKTREKGLN
jgi:hypothetical membrane protein